MIQIDINTMTPNEVIDAIAQLPRTERDLKKLQDVPLFEYLFTLTGGKIETITRGKNIGKPKYIAPAGYNYDRANVYKILTGISREELVSVDTILKSDFYFRVHDLEGVDSYLNVKTPTEKYRRTLYRWYWSYVPFKVNQTKLEIIKKSPLWSKLYDELLEKARLVQSEEGYFHIEDYNKYHFDLQPQIDAELALLNN